MVNLPAGLNNLKTQVDDLDVGKWETVPIDLKKLSDAVDKKMFKNTKFNKLNTKVNNLENKIPANQHSKDKQSLEKKTEDSDKKNTRL